MILNPSIIALLGGSALLCAFAVYASFCGIRIIRHWDIRSGSELQLALERKTYLVSAICGCLLGFELFSLFLFTYTADHIHSLFVGAMCAAGSLNVNVFGYPTLVMKLINSILCGVWLFLNHADNRGFDYPVIRPKYKLLLVITALVTAETILQTFYFLQLKGDVITSCCGTLFSKNAETLAGELASIPAYPAQIILYLSFVLTVRVGLYFYTTGNAAALLAGLSNWLFIFALISVISFISLYFYQLPTHHCPFCLLQKEYHYIGYPLYVALLGAGIAGASIGVINHFRRIASLKDVIPEIQRRLCLFVIAGYSIFVLISIYPVLFSDFKLQG